MEVNQTVPYQSFVSRNYVRTKIELVCYLLESESAAESLFIKEIDADNFVVIVCTKPNTTADSFDSSL